MSLKIIDKSEFMYIVDAVKAMDFVKEKMIPYYPLGVYKDIKEGK